eukprot:182021_1
MSMLTTLNSKRFITISLICIWTLIGTFQFTAMFHSVYSSTNQHEITTNLNNYNSYNICNRLYTEHIILGSHHKTGTHLLREFLFIFKKYFEYECNTSLSTKQRRKWIQCNVIIIRCIRNPVD